MSFLLNSMRSSTFAKFGPISRSQAFTRRISTETSGASHSAPTSSLTSSLIDGSWDPNNRIRVAGAALGVAGVLGMMFDTFYRRVTKEELSQAVKELDTKIDKLDAKIGKEMEKLDAKIDKGMGQLDAKIDSLTHALLHTHQRDKIAAETENRELRRELEKFRNPTIQQILPTP